MSTKDRFLSQGELTVMLAVQRRGHDAYGVTIRDEIEARTGQRKTFGVLYTILGRLERDGLLKATEGDPTPERGGRPKRFFTLTGTGVAVLGANLNAIDQMRAPGAPRPAVGLRALAQKTGLVIWTTIATLCLARVAVAQGSSGAYDYTPVTYGTDTYASNDWVTYTPVGYGAGNYTATDGIIATLSISVLLISMLVLREFLPLFWRNFQKTPLHQQTPDAGPLKFAECFFWLILPLKDRAVSMGDMDEAFRQSRERWRWRWIAHVDYLKEGIVAFCAAYWRVIERVVSTFWRTP
ncbi:MAG: PadR family transcriptional regulator [Planctomycetota bacterium]